MWLRLRMARAILLGRPVMYRMEVRRAGTFLLDEPGGDAIVTPKSIPAFVAECDFHTTKEEDSR